MVNMHYGAINSPKGWRTVTVTTVLSWFMKFLMVGLVPYEIYKGEYLFTFAAVLAVGLSLVPSIVQRSYRVTLPFEIDLLFTLSLFLHTFMGEGLDFYQKLWWWDKSLHFFNTAVIALIAFVIVYTLHYSRKVRLTIPMIGVFTVSFALAVGALWEIGEFIVDGVFNKTTQNGLADTMWDLIQDFIGGVIVSILGMFYVRYSKPEDRKRLTKPIGEVFGIGRRIDRIKDRFQNQGPRNSRPS